MPVKCLCKLCNKEFEAYPSEIKKGGGKFCCSKHYHQWISENKTKSGKNSNLWKNAKVPVTCKNCGTVKLVYKSQIKWRGSSFCSRKCRSEWIAKNKSGKDSWNWKNKIKRTCKTCGTKFEIDPSTAKRLRGKYCSQECYGISISGINNLNWNNGSSFGGYCYKFNTKRKHAVRSFFGNMCICCGKNTSENITNSGIQKELSVHHVDHDKNQGCDGHPFNLVPMCNECHPKELNHQTEYKIYINKTLEEGFKWGIWSKEQYVAQVMYP
jgi:hypothetical protein